MNTKMMGELRNDLTDRLIIRINKNGEITSSQRYFLESHLLEQYENHIGERGQANVLQTY